MLIQFSLKLKCLHGGKNFSIVTKKDQYVVSQNCEMELEIDCDYLGQSDIELFSVVGITAGLGQRVSVVEVKRNSEPWGNYFVFTRFLVRENPKMENRTVSPCWELCFNGDFGIFVDAGRGEFEFSPWYRSRQRQDFVFWNIHLSANDKHSEYWCNHVSCFLPDNWRETHGVVLDNEPFMPEYQQSEQYEYGCFGCSLTKGTGLKKGEEWPALLRKDCGSVINLSEERLGADGIFLNLKSALQRFRLGRVIILWPNLDRWCWRSRVDEWHLRYAITATCKADDFWGEIWVDRQKYCEALSVFRDRCMKDRNGPRSRRIIARAVKLLKEMGLPAWHSSWDMDTYRYLESLSLGDGLLQPFPKSDHGAIDKSHPSAGKQRSWYEMIKKQITETNGKA